MDLIYFGILGMIAVQGSTLCQIVKFIRVKKTAGVSIGFWWVILSGLSCYLVYSIYIHDWLYICSNTLGIVLSGISIMLYYYYRKLEKRLDGK